VGESGSAGKKEGTTMRKLLLGLAILTMLAGAGSAKAQEKPLRVVIKPGSTVYRADIMKNLSEKCPNITITQDSKKSDFMLEAMGWSGNYHFTVYKHGGDAVYATQTQWLSNAVKDVCKYVNSHDLRNPEKSQGE
jgi:hypothetical protein